MVCNIDGGHWNTISSRHNAQVYADDKLILICDRSVRSIQVLTGTNEDFAAHQSYGKSRSLPELPNGETPTAARRDCLTLRSLGQNHGGSLGFSQVLRNCVWGRSQHLANLVGYTLFGAALAVTVYEESSQMEFYQQDDQVLGGFINY